jgi:hypothetical protein
MSRLDQEFDVQPATETDLLQDPDYLTHTAREEGEWDYDKGIPILDGFRKLKDRGAISEEIDAYGHGWMRGALFAIARDAGIAEQCEVEAVV